MYKLFISGWRDIFAALNGYELAGILGMQDIRQRYRRSSLGPFWITISMGVLIGALGLVFGNLFAAPMKEFFPFLTIELICGRSLLQCSMRGVQGSLLQRL